MAHDRAAKPFFFRANFGECIVFEATNPIPSTLNLDVFQMFSPTDTIAQHIHPVKFDVMAPAGRATAGTTTPGSSGRTAEGTDRREHPLPGLC